MRGRPLCLLAPQGKGAQDVLGSLEGLLRPGELVLDPSPLGEGPLGHDDGLALGVVERVLEEPAAHEIDEPSVAQRVLGTRGHLDDLGFGLGALGGDGDDGGRHEVHRDHVDDALGHAGELLQQAPGVADDDRVGHPEATDPPGTRFGECGLDDGRAHDADRYVAAGLDKGPFAEGLGVGVRVRPAERRSSGSPGADHAVADPTGAVLLGLVRQGGRAGRTERLAGVGAELRQHLGGSALRLGVATGLTGTFDFAAPVDIDEERALVDQLFGGRPSPVPGHVAGGDGDEVRGDAEVVQRRSDAAGSEEVHLHRTVERGVEAHRGGGVDDGVARGERRPSVVVEAQPVAADVAGHRGDPSRRHLGEAVLAELGSQAVEGVVLQDLAGDALLHASSACPAGRAGRSRSRGPRAAGARAGSCRGSRSSR